MILTICIRLHCFELSTSIHSHNTTLIIELLNKMLPQTFELYIRSKVVDELSGEKTKVKLDVETAVVEVTERLQKLAGRRKLIFQVR